MTSLFLPLILDIQRLTMNHSRQKSVLLFIKRGKTKR
nr:MAG TPA: hypothetical protein [Caudoviricetes sp.]